jgi:hypothetical protein
MEGEERNRRACVAFEKPVFYTCATSCGKMARVRLEAERKIKGRAGCNIFTRDRRRHCRRRPRRHRPDAHKLRGREAPPMAPSIASRTASPTRAHTEAVHA